MTSKTKSRRLIRSVVAVCAAAGLFGAYLAGAADEAASAKSSRVPVPSVAAAKGEQCVEPTEVMRRDHMKFILHQRDKTMHEGVRTKQHSLKNCIECHADPKTNSVLGENGFCASCHAYAAVSMDCFSCHTDKRQVPASAGYSPTLGEPAGHGRLNHAVSAFAPGTDAATVTSDTTQ